MHYWTLYAFAWLICYCFLWLGVDGQNLTIPSNWQTSTPTLNRAQCEALASGAAQLLAGEIVSGTGSISGLDAISTASIAAVLALQDWYTGDGTWKAQVLDDILGFYATQHPTYANNRTYGSWSPDTLHIGLAAYYAYRTYNASSALQLAVDNWELAYLNYVTGTSGLAGPPSRTTNFTSSCASQLAGGVFVQPPSVAAGAEISTDSSSMMISLSGYLYNLTRNATYLQTAELTGQFMLMNFYTPGTPIVAGISVTDCSSQATSQDYTWNTGLFVQGIAVLASITGNSSYHDILQDLVLLAEDPVWTSPQDGHIFEQFVGGPEPAGDNALKGVYIRALAEAARLNPGTPMVAYIQAYILVQLYAVTQSAHANGTDFYSPYWAGPASIAFDPLGSLAALDVMNPALTFLAAGPSTAPGSNETSSASTQMPSASVSTGPDAKTSDTGAIIGGVVGGVGGFAGLALAAFILRRRIRRGRSASVVDVRSSAIRMQERTQPNTHYSTEPEPFLARHPAADASQTKWSPTLLSGSALGSATMAGEGSPSTPISSTSVDTRAAQLSNSDRDIVYATLTDHLVRIQNLLSSTPGELTSQSEEPPQYVR